MGTNKQRSKAYPHHLTDNIESIIKQGPPKGRKSKKAEDLLNSINDTIEREYPEYIKRQKRRRQWTPKAKYKQLGTK